MRAWPNQVEGEEERRRAWRRYFGALSHGHISRECWEEMTSAGADVYVEPVQEFSDEWFCDAEELQKILEAAELGPKEAMILKLLFFDDVGFEETGKRFDVTRERIRQRLLKMLKWLRLVGHCLRMGYPIPKRGGTLADRMARDMERLGF